MKHRKRRHPLSRLRSALDTSWAGGGELLFAAPDANEAFAGTIDANGMLLLTGATGLISDLFVKRYDPVAETNDPGFNGGGDLVPPKIYGATTYQRGEEIVVEGSGDIIVAGGVDDATPAELAAWRITSGGAGGFNTDEGRRVLIQSDDKIVVVGAAKSGNPRDMVILRLM
jgi:hypothetical protein